jgi:hypothetical protein
VRIVLGRDFDGGSWLGALGAGEAAIGVSWVGPLGFAGLLETALGLTGLYPDDTERAAELAATVGSTEGFWSRSAERDLLGSAARLLSWRDELWESGFRGAPTGQPRLDALAAVTFGVSPGLPDRLEAICLALSTRHPGIDTVELADSEDGFPLTWRQVLDALRARGVSVSGLAVPTSTSTASGDLASSNGSPFTPRGDHTLQLLRPGSSADAAEHVAAWTAALEPAASVVVVGSDLQLDRALARFGVPMVGASTPSSQNPLLAVLPLVVEIGWWPADPQQALELLALRRSPLPAGLAWRLVDALGSWPAVDSDSWRQSLERGLARIDDPADRANVADRVARIFGSSAPRLSAYPVAAILERANLVDDWLAELKPSSRAEAVAVRAARRQVEELRQLATQLGHEVAGEPQLRRLLSLATAAAGDTAATDAQAGINTVSRPGAIVGPADHVVWWDFTQSSVRPSRPMFLSLAERAALESAGVELADPGAEARRSATRWRRPFEQARGSLLLVCPRTSPNGDEEFAHPAWDEIVARIPKDARPGVAALEVATPRSGRKIPITTCPPRDLPVPSPTVKIPAGRIRLRETESPSSLGKLVGCNFAYSVHYAADISCGHAVRVQKVDSPLLRGNLAHELLSRALTSAEIRDLKEDAATSSAVAELFDREAPRLAAVLYLPGADRSRDSIRDVIIKSALRLLKEVRRRGGAVVTETRFEKKVFGTTVAGRVDLLLENPALVVDLKLGGAKYRREELESGSAYQLAVYANLIGTPGRKTNPAVAYFILADQRWLTTDGHAIDGVFPERGPTTFETWKALERAVAAETAELASGQVTARGCGEENTSEDQCGIAEDGRLHLSSPCGYCDFDGLCGRTYEVPEVAEVGEVAE